MQSRVSLPLQRALLMQYLRLPRARGLQAVLLAGVAFAGAMAASVSVCHAELARVWALDDGTKVKADELEHRLAAKNGVFDGTSVRLFGARNETVAFQLILEGGAGASDNVQVQLAQVGSIKNDPPGDQPDSYYVGRRIELFQELYLDVRTRSRGLVWEHQAAMPPGLSGPIPDPLVPLELLTKLTVAARRNQGIWVDIYIPKDTPVGLHKGAVQVLESGKPCARPGCQLPIELRVLDATLPDEPPVRTMLYFSGNEPGTVLGRYFADPRNVSPEQVKALRDRHYRLGRRHLVTMFIGQDSAPNTDVEDLVSGRTFSAERGYQGWGEGAGQDLYSIHTYGGRLTATQARQWSDWMAARSQRLDYFLYVWDEPAKSAFDQINAIAAQAKPVPAFVTTAYAPELNDVDIFCAVPGLYRRDAAKAAKDAGKRMWIYNGQRPFSGSFAIDDVAVSPRVNPWIQHARGIERWFFWEATYYNNNQGGGGQINVFREPLNFSNSWGDHVNGDGLLVYPGRDHLFPGEDRGFNAPLPSIRLKNWRRGIQDVAYLQLAKTAGKTSEHDAAVQALIPTVLGDERRYDQPVAWNEDGEAWLAAREKLAQLFAHEGAVVAPPPGAAPPEPLPSPNAAIGLSGGGGWISSVAGNRLEGGSGTTILFAALEGERDGERRSAVLSGGCTTRGASSGLPWVTLLILALILGRQRGRELVEQAIDDLDLVEGAIDPLAAPEEVAAGLGE